jgi:hypothetical protein
MPSLRISEHGYVLPRLSLQQEPNMPLTLENTQIDYRLFDIARAHYDRRGYVPIEVPWMVDSKVSLITTPKKEYAYATKPSQHLVGSAEQGFLQMALNGTLAPEARFQAITPCFRRDVPDESHSRWFMKLELFQWFERPLKDRVKVDLDLGYMRDSAWALFKNLTDLKKHHLLVCPTTDDIEHPAFDINLNGIEIGSYGIRSYKPITWVYGTGLALPRLTYAMKKE